ncbi:MAG TPA: hypothetical protein VGC79_10075 [Polyangiaceae bacterium]
MKRQSTTTSSPKKPRKGPSTPWPTVEDFLDSGGTVQLGAIDPHGPPAYVAVASDESNMLVALVRKRRESLHQLLDRLESALGPALEEDIFVDEINGPG